MKNSDIGGGAELLVFRKGCADRQRIREVPAFFLSSRIQLFFGKVRGGIPSLRSAAAKTRSRGSSLSRTAAAAGIPEVSAKYNIRTENLFNLITNGVNRIFSLSPEKFEYELRRLADAVRTVYDVERHANGAHGAGSG